MEWNKTDMVRRKSPPSTDPVRRLSFEMLERRHMLSATNLGAIAGTVYDDLTGTGYSPSDPGLANVPVQLYLSNSGNTFNAATDTLEQTQTTNASGQYEFTGLSAGTYFVRQEAPTGYQQLPGGDVSLVTISANQAAGTEGTIIDSFNQTQQAVNATIFQNQTLATSLVAAPEAIGGYRGLYADLTSPSGDIGLSADEITPDELEYTSGSVSAGVRSVTWDGTPGNGPALNPIGLRNGGTTGVDLTNSGASTGLQLSIGADQNGGTITLLVYTDASNASTVTVDIPNTTTGAATSTVIIPFSSFTTLLGSGANFSNVGAVQLQVTGVDGVDGDISLISAIGPNVQTVNMQNFNQLSLGNLVWNDLNNNGLYNSATEPGMANVKLDLYSVPTASSTFSPSDTLVTTTTTNSNGGYLFTNLFPGNYIVQIDPSNFTSGGALVGYEASTGLSPVPGANDGVYGENKGTSISGEGVVGGTINLTGNGAPLVGGNTNPNSYVTMDFGLVGTADLAVNKTASPDPVIAGNDLTYTITATNNGPIAATGVQVVDALPSNVTYVSSSAGTFNAATDTLSDSIGNLAVNATQQFTVVVAVAAGYTGSVTNTAVISGNQPDPNPDNNTSTVTVPVNAEADLAIVKTGTPSPVTAGQPITYTLTATNNGPSNATGVNITDVLPTGLTFVSATAGTYNAATDTFTDDVGNLAEGASTTVTLVATVGVSVTGSIINTATIAGDQPDPNMFNNTSTVVTPVDAAADLAIVKTASPNPVVAGTTLTYTLTATNNGPVNATGVTITDPLPTGVTYVSSSAGTFNASNDTLTDAVGNLAVGASQTITVTVTVGASVTGTISNTATISGNQPDPNLANNTSTAVTTVTPEADLSIVKTGAPNPVVAGNNLTYTLTATNNGPSTATGVTISDPLPAGETFVSSTGGTFNSGSDTLTDAVGTLAVGASQTITVTVTVGASVTGTISNTATVTGNQPDPNPANNTSTAITTVTTQSNVTIVKTGTPNPVVAGNNLTYTLTVSNSGPSTATGVTITDPLPAGETFVSTTGGTFNSGSDTLTDAVGTLAVGASQSITVTVTVGASVTGSLTNTATVTTTQPNPGPNTSTVITTVTPEADLSITKTASAATATPGADLGYTLVITNNGPSNATNVVVSDLLPSSLTYNSDTDGGTLAPATNTDNFSLGTLTPGQTVTISIDTTVNFNAPDGPLTNLAEVSSPTSDPNLSNNLATATTTIQEVLSSISGIVYVDPSNTGVYVSSDQVLAGVTVYLTGTNRLGDPVSMSTITNSAGQYTFSNMVSGNYNVSSSPVSGYTAGKITTGTGASADAVDGAFSNLALDPDSAATNFNFAEDPSSVPFSKRLFLAFD